MKHLIEKSPVTQKDHTILYCSTMEEVQSAIEDKTFVFPQILEGIKRMLKNDLEVAQIVEIWCIETLSSIWITVTLEECPSSLQLMLDWYVGREEYEECSEVRAVTDEVELRLLRRKPAYSAKN